MTSSIAFTVVDTTPENLLPPSAEAFYLPHGALDIEGQNPSRNGSCAQYEPDDQNDAMGGGDRSFEQFVGISHIGASCQEQRTSQRYREVSSRDH